MQTFGRFLVATLAAGMAAASALRRDVPGGTFEITQVRNPNFTGKIGPLALAKAYIKYGKPLPDDLAQAVARIQGNVKRAEGTQAATPAIYDTAYYCEGEIGTPPQTIPLDFDTGSSDLWVFSTQLPPQNTTGHVVYNPGASSTAEKLSGYTWNITYGDGSSSSGTVDTDVVTVGGLTVTSQAVELADTVSSEFVEATYLSGLLGLAFDKLNQVQPVPQSTWFFNAIPQLSEPLFSANLKHDAPSSYLFGGTDASQYTGSITYVPVDSTEGFWGFESSGFAIDGGGILGGIFLPLPISGIADTGTTLLLLPDDIVDAYYLLVPTASYSSSQAGYIFNCDATLPDFIFGIGNSRITIPASYMNAAPVSSSQCYGGLQSSSGLGINIFGDVALKSAYVVFDNNNGQPRIGWASKDL